MFTDAEAMVRTSDQRSRQGRPLERDLFTMSADRTLETQSRLLD